MDYYSMTDKGIGAEMGHRIRSLRLRKNLTQQQVASLESGKGKLLTLIAVLRELNALDALNNFIPEPAISPLQLARQQGKKRQRASGKRLKGKATERSEW